MPQTHPFPLSLLLLAAIAGLAALLAVGGQASSPLPSAAAPACPISVPILITPPEDDAVQDTPQPGYYYVNEDRSIWASARWAESEENRWHAGENGNKVGWFRPAGAPLEITGRRLDGEAPPLLAEVPCCYPTRFQATGLYFPSSGCWQVTARAGGSLLEFNIRVAP